MPACLTGPLVDLPDGRLQVICLAGQVLIPFRHPNACMAHKLRSSEKGTIKWRES